MPEDMLNSDNKNIFSEDLLILRKKCVFEIPIIAHMSCIHNQII